MEDKVIIKNRRDVPLFVIYEGRPEHTKLAFLAHGFGEVHDTPHMRALCAGLAAAGYDVVRWDATNSSWGRSGGSSRQATLTGMTEDMEDVITWSRTRPWYREPFIVVGFSMGGAAALKYAVAHPHRLDRLILVAPMVAGRLTARHLNPAWRALWRLVRVLPMPRDRARRYHYELLRDAFRYDGRELAVFNNVPTAIISGTADRTIPIHDVRALYDALPPHGHQFIEIPGAGHGFRDHLSELMAAIQRASLEPLV